jgi:uncharacterized damage-inducible protein DinB
MNADGYRGLFDYHFDTYARIWASIDTLEEAEFTQKVDYSLGSLRDHMVHQMDVDRGWASVIRGEPRPEGLKPEHFATRAAVKEHWDQAEVEIRERLVDLTDELLASDQHFPLPASWGGPKDTPMWLVLTHVLNHGTDHRAQILRLLHDLGAPTFPQDLIFHAWGVQTEA